MRLALSLVLLCAAAPTRAAIGDWPATTLPQLPDGYVVSAAAATGDGGAFVFWAGEVTWDSLYCVRVLADGSRPPGEPPKGRALLLPTGNLAQLRAIPDGAGGIFLAWIACAPPGTPHTQCWEAMNGRLFHVDAQGDPSPGWPSTGLEIVLNPSLPIPTAWSVTSDDSGGIVVAREAFPERVWVQRFDVNGTALWPGGAGGVAVRDAPGSQRRPRVSARDGRVVVTWVGRDAGQDDTYLQAFALDGTRVWADGLAITSGAADEIPMAVAALPDGGALVATLSDSPLAEATVMRLDAAGAPLWDPPGAPLVGGVAPLAADEVVQMVVRDDGYAHVLYRDSGTLLRYSLLDPLGDPVRRDPWGTTETTGALALLDQIDGGAMVLWNRIEAGGRRVMAMSLDALGRRRTGWPAGGQRVATDTASVLLSGAAVERRAGRAYVTWQPVDLPPSAGVQRLSVPVAAAPDGVRPAVAFAAVRPNPARGTARVELALTRPASVRVDVFDVAGRRVLAPIERALAAGRHALTIDGVERLAPGLYRVRVRGRDESVTRTLVRLR